MNADLLEECRGVMEKNPFASWIGIELLEVQEGYVRAKAKKRKELENIYGDIHGGCLYTIADNMAGVAAATYGYYVTTVNGSIQYLRAGRDTECIYCDAKVMKPGKRISVVRVEITDDGGNLINTAEFTYYNLRRKDVVKASAGARGNDCPLAGQA